MSSKINLSSETGGQVLQFKKSKLCAMVLSVTLLKSLARMPPKDGDGLGGGLVEKIECDRVPDKLSSA